MPSKTQAAHSTLEESRLPVSLLTGFLGSGKTTILNFLLQHPGMSKTAVIINEFGAIGLDHELIEHTEEDTVLLQSGCICCTVRGDLIATLSDLLRRRACGEVSTFARVVIETTGLADPAPILHTLMTAPEIATRFRLDGVIATVDAATGNATLDRQPEATKQAAVADRILLTKTDIASPSDVAGLRDRLRRLNPAAPILVAENGIVSPESLFNAGPYNPETKSPDVRQWLNAEAYQSPSPPLSGSGAPGRLPRKPRIEPSLHPHDPNRHDDRIRAICLVEDEPIDGSVFVSWLESLVLLKGEDLLRVKGIINIAGLKAPLVIHGVQHVFHPPVTLRKWPGKDRRSKLVLIVRDLEESTLRDSLKRFIHAARGETRWTRVEDQLDDIIMYELKQ
ncbi:MAG TPA: GTP-binding protein [Candidatus Binatia bacterium]|nr:GTP-binding protein [Candidatus Binatia bacterium]